MLGYAFDFDFDCFTHFRQRSASVRIAAYVCMFGGYWVAASGLKCCGRIVNKKKTAGKKDNYQRKRQD